MTKYGVQAGAFSKAIHVGRLEKDGHAFADKEDHTGDVFQAVADWVERNHGGSAWVNVGGKRIDIEVTPITEEDAS